MTLHLKAEAEDAGVRLDAFVAYRANGLTRSQAARYIDEGRVAVDGKPASKSCRIDSLRIGADGSRSIIGSDDLLHDVSLL